MDRGEDGGVATATGPDALVEQCPDGSGVRCPLRAPEVDHVGAEKNRVILHCGEDLHVVHLLKALLGRQECMNYRPAQWLKRYALVDVLVSIDQRGLAHKLQAITRSDALFRIEHPLYRNRTSRYKRLSASDSKPSVTLVTAIPFRRLTSSDQSDREKLQPTGRFLRLDSCTLAVALLLLPEVRQPPNDRPRLLRSSCANY